MIEAYSDFLSDETLKDRTYKCEKCKKKVKCKIKREIVKMPKYVLFLFKRFDFVHGRKSPKVPYSESIWLSDQFNPEEREYKLNGIIIHTGGLSGGHYTAI